MLKAWPESSPIQDIDDFIGRVLAEYFRRGKKIRKLVIGSHGAAGSPGYGGIFYLGKTAFMDGYDDLDPLLEKLTIVRPAFMPGADVYLMSCETGRDDKLLRKVSAALGGVTVHGYTSFITATDYWFFATVSDETDDGVREIACWPTECRDITDER